MPRRNLWLLGMLVVVCVTCHWRSHRYGRVLAFAMDQIDQKFLGKIDEQKLFEGAVKGMVGRLEDQYSEYIPPQGLKEFNEAIYHRFAGIGVEIVVDPDSKQITVASPIFDSPAEQAGVRPGDRILRVDGKSTQGLSVEDAAGLIRGEAGTPVTLTIQHVGDDKPVDVGLVRARVQAHTVLGYARTSNGGWDYFLEGENRLGYLRITGFGADTPKELQQAVRSLLDRGMKGLVIDLRNNPGGLLPPAVQICDMFISQGVIVSMRRRDGSVKDVYTASGGADDWLDFPLAVLVNRYSASASEIVAACLQDHGRAVIVGERSYGKGTVQEIIEFAPSQGEIKLTTASYWRPSQKNINRVKNADENAEWGVSPDPGYSVTLEADQLARFARWRQWFDYLRVIRAAGPKTNGAKDVPEARTQAEVDPQLAKALEFLRTAAP